MATIVFPCGRCGTKNEADAALAGRQIACGHCGNPLTLPWPRTVPAPPAAAPEPLSYKYTCGACGKRHQVPEALFGKRVRCQACGMPMTLPVPPGYAPRGASPPKPNANASPHPTPTPAPKPRPRPELKTFDEPPRAPLPPLRTFDAPAPAPAPRAMPSASAPAVAPARPAAAVSASARPKPASPSPAEPLAAIPIDDDDIQLLDLDDDPAPAASPRRPAAAVAAPVARPPRAPAPAAADPARDADPGPLDVFGLDDDAPPPSVRRPARAADEDEAAPRPFVPRTTFKPAKKPQKSSSSSGRGRMFGFVGGGFGGVGAVIFFIIRVALRLSPMFNQGDAEATIKKFNQYWRDAAVMLREVHDVASARATDPKVAAILRKATRLAEETKSMKIPKSFKKYLDDKYKGESFQAGLQVGVEMRRIAMIPGALDAMSEFKAEFEHFSKVSAELARQEAEGDSSADDADE
ncbi:MAG TPA: hypothetical protein VG406_05480 [Isosphaeraceae bacterium]|jgi:DNA-directed RNA polymerase subunit RPC12/RpoP|nr:hypothetical protein [Isosphaeraceae bacterium]